MRLHRSVFRESVWFASLNLQKYNENRMQTKIKLLKAYKSLTVYDYQVIILLRTYMYKSNLEAVDCYSEANFGGC